LSNWTGLNTGQEILARRSTGALDSAAGFPRTGFVQLQATPSAISVPASSSDGGGSGSSSTGMVDPYLPSVTANPAAPPIDVRALADRVYQMLVKRLASERERRGAE
jgi:hypothetical protein